MQSSKTLFAITAAVGALSLTAPVAQAATVAFSALPTSAAPLAAPDASTGSVSVNVIGSTSTRRSVWQEAGADTGVQFEAADSYYTAVHANSTATYKLDAPVYTMSFAWGSPDTYNKIEFWNMGVIVDTFQLSGMEDITPASFSKDGGTASFSDIAGGMGFDAVTFSSIGLNAFEYANLDIAAVPLPAGGLLLLGGLGGFAALRRRKSQAA